MRRLCIDPIARSQEKQPDGNRTINVSDSQHAMSPGKHGFLGTMKSLWLDLIDASLHANDGTFIAVCKGSDAVSCQGHVSEEVPFALNPFMT